MATGNPAQSLFSVKDKSDVPDFIVVPPYESFSSSPLYAYLDVRQILNLPKMKNILSTPFYSMSPCLIVDGKTLIDSAILNINDFLWLLMNNNIKVRVTKMTFKMEFLKDSLSKKQLLVILEVDYGKLENLARFPPRLNTLIFPLILNISIETYTEITSKFVLRPESVNIEFTQMSRSVMSESGEAKAIAGLTPFSRKLSISSAFKPQ